ncbi:MAG: GNAT family N-acetyltransferase [Verrucomicrobiae bacterium]|nr:GNAT family N-acetyltransferase [Verrucomicrobiae bacterium]
MTLGYLADSRQFLPELARWHHEEWGWLHPGDTVEARAVRLEGECGRGAIPTVLVAMEGQKLLGSSMLVAQDMESRPQWSPWLASVFVAPDRRGEGIGTALVRRAMEEAARMKVGRLYLYTPSAERFYTRLGWSLIERTPYHGAEVAVMQFEFPG